MRYYGFLSVGQRQRLAALREQLSRLAVEDTLTPEDASEGEQIAGDQASLARGRTEVHCPPCGQVMRRGAAIRPTAHGPP